MTAQIEIQRAFVATWQAQRREEARIERLAKTTTAVPPAAQTHRDPVLLHRLQVERTHVAHARYDAGACPGSSCTEGTLAA